jgi:hypothetical protein
VIQARLFDAVWSKQGWPPALYIKAIVARAFPGLAPQLFHGAGEALRALELLHLADQLAAGPIEDEE